MMKLAINPATTQQGRFEEDVRAYAKAGFEAMELWLGKVDAYLEENHSLEDAAALMDDNGLEAAGACFCGVQCSGDEAEEESLEQLKRQLATCQALGADTMVVIPGVDDDTITEESFEKVAEGLGRSGEIAQSYGVSLAIEFIQGSPLIGSVLTATKVARQSGRENVGVLLDTFHFYVGISKIHDIYQMRPEELLIVHLNDCRDVHRELANDSMRVFPGEGVFPLKQILGAIADIGYEGYLSLELFNEEVWEMNVEEAARLSHEKAEKFMRSLP